MELYKKTKSKDDQFYRDGDHNLSLEENNISDVIQDIRNGNVNNLDYVLAKKIIDSGRGSFVAKNISCFKIDSHNAIACYLTSDEQAREIFLENIKNFRGLKSEIAHYLLDNNKFDVLIQNFESFSDLDFSIASRIIDYFPTVQRYYRISLSRALPPFNLFTKTDQEKIIDLLIKSDLSQTVMDILNYSNFEGFSKNEIIDKFFKAGKVDNFFYSVIYRQELEDIDQINAIKILEASVDFLKNKEMGFSYSFQDKVVRSFKELDTSIADKLFDMKWFSAVLQNTSKFKGLEIDNSKLEYIIKNGDGDSVIEYLENHFYEYSQNKKNDLSKIFNILIENGFSQDVLNLFVEKPLLVSGVDVNKLIELKETNTLLTHEVVSRFTEKQLNKIAKKAINEGEVFPILRNLSVFKERPFFRLDTSLLDKIILFVLHTEDEETYYTSPNENNWSSSPYKINKDSYFKMLLKGAKIFDVQAEEIAYKIIENGFWEMFAEDYVFKYIKLDFSKILNFIFDIGKEDEFIKKLLFEMDKSYVDYRYLTLNKTLIPKFLDKVLLLIKDGLILEQRTRKEIVNWLFPDKIIDGFEYNKEFIKKISELGSLSEILKKIEKLNDNKINKDDLINSVFEEAMNQKDYEIILENLEQFKNLNVQEFVNILINSNNVNLLSRYRKQLLESGFSFSEVIPHFVEAGNLDFLSSVFPTFSKYIDLDFLKNENINIDPNILDKILRTNINYNNDIKSNTIKQLQQFYLKPENVEDLNQKIQNILEINGNKDIPKVVLKLTSPTSKDKFVHMVDSDRRSYVIALPQGKFLFHKNIVDFCEKTYNKNFHSITGGWIKQENGKIVLYGESGDFGKSDKEVVKNTIQKVFSDVEIIIE